MHANTPTACQQAARLLFFPPHQLDLSQLIISSFEPWAQSMIALSINASMIYFDGASNDKCLARAFVCVCVLVCVCKSVCVCSVLVCMCVRVCMCVFGPARMQSCGPFSRVEICLSRGCTSLNAHAWTCPCASLRDSRCISVCVCVLGRRVVVMVGGGSVRGYSEPVQTKLGETCAIAWNVSSKAPFYQRPPPSQTEIGPPRHFLIIPPPPPPSSSWAPRLSFTPLRVATFKNQSADDSVGRVHGFDCEVRRAGVGRSEKKKKPLACFRCSWANWQAKKKENEIINVGRSWCMEGWKRNCLTE